MWINISEEYINSTEKQVIEELAKYFAEENAINDVLQTQIDELAEQIKEIKNG